MARKAKCKRCKDTILDGDIRGGGVTTNVTWAVHAADDGWDEQFGNPLFKREIDRGPVFCLHCLDNLGGAIEEAMRAWEANEDAITSNSG